MTPCLDCGEPTKSGPRCRKCRTSWRKGHANQNRSHKWTKFSKKLRAEHPYCAECGTSERLEVDHIVPLIHGGAEFDRSNCRVLCASCHGRLGAERRR